MLPPIVTQIMAIIQIALQFAPAAASAYDRAREVIKLWFDGGVITYEQQRKLMDWADKHQEDTLAGRTPVELVVEEDPTSPQPPV